MREIRYRRYQPNVLEHLWVLWKSVQWKPYYTYGDEWEFARHFYIFVSCRITFGKYDHKIFEWCISWKSFNWKPYFIEGHKLISVCTFHFYFPIWVKFSIGDLFVMLLNIGEFRENRPMEVRTFRMSVNKNCIYECTVKLWYFQSQEQLGNVCVLCRGVHH